jgi:hypothetical protein
MSTSWKIILIILSSIIIVAAGYFGYRYYKHYNQPNINAVLAINPGCVMYAQIQDPRSLLAGLNQDTEWWQSLKNIPSLKKIDDILMHFDSLVAADPWVTEVLEVGNTYLVVDEVSDSHFAFVFLVELPNGNGKTGVNRFLQNVLGKTQTLKERQFQDANISNFRINELEKDFHFSVYRGLFIGSFNPALIERSIGQINDGVPVNINSDFRKMEATAGKNVDANVYINHSSFSHWVSQVTHKKKSSSILALANLGFWSETDLIIKTDEVLLNGYTVTSDSLNILERYKTTPQAIKIPEILPYNTAWMLNMGIGYFADFYKNNITAFQQDPNARKKFLETNNINLEKDIFSWVGPEISISTFGKNGNVNKNHVVVIRTKDVLKADIILEDLSTQMALKQRKKEFVKKYGEYTIKKLFLPEFLPFLFGPGFSSLKENYYLAIRDFIVFANDPETLIQVIDHFYNHKTLSENLNYQSFSNNISDNSNIYLYLNTHRSSDLASINFSEPVAKWLKEYKNVLQSFEGLAVQFSYINQMFYTNIYVKYNPEYKEINPTAWEFELDANIAKAPSLVTNHRNGKLNVIAFDENKNMYLLDHLGQLKWKLPLVEKPISEVFQVDYYKNGKHQYLFNTSNYIYLIDLNGNYVADFPVKLSASATASLNVFDYNDDMEYRIVIPLNDNKVYNFDIHGKPVEGWNKIQTRATVHNKVEHLVAKNKDYLFTTDENGNVTITNRRGEVRVKMKKDFSKAVRASIYVNETNNKGLFLTTDENGKLAYISSKGKVQYTNFGDFSANHFFLYEDFDQNGSKDFIYLDGDHLIVFDRFKKVLLEQQLEENVSVTPKLFRHMGITYLGLVLSGKNEIMIFDKTGRVYNDELISGSIGFTAGSLNMDNKLNLISGIKNNVKGSFLED